jgi:hypothetical protein
LPRRTTRSARLLLGRGRLVSNETAEHLPGVLERDPHEQLDDLGHRELVEQHLDLRLAHRGVV